MENLEAEPKIGTTNRLQEQMKSVLLKESLQIRLRKEIEEYLNANYVPFRLVKEIHDVISDSGQKKLYLHEMLFGSSLHLPEYEAPPRAIKYRCYFCSFKCNELDECVNHCVTHHSGRQVNLRTYVLDMVSGLLGYQTKRYPVVPDNLPKDKFVGVIGDKVLKWRKF